MTVPGATSPVTRFTRRLDANFPIFRLLVSNHVNDERQSSMKTLKIIFQLLRRCLMGLFITYWVIFIFYTVEEFVTGGSNAVVGRYRHIDSPVVQRGDGWFLRKWTWEKFLVRQFAIFAITLALYFVERRSKRMPRNQDD